MSTADDLGYILRVYWSLFLGNIVEWYEFAVYGYLEPYLESCFFRGSAIAAWLGFTVTFLARPLGGMLLGRVGDVLGRRAAVNISIVGMLIGTCGQGLLPTYASGNDTLGLVGIVLLVLLRFLQGVSAAGEISTISTYITEVGPHKSLGRAIALISITCNLGFLLAKAVIFTLNTFLGEGAMQAWGWRAPFVLALLPGLIAVAGRRGLPESEAFLEQQRSAAAGGAAAEEEEKEDPKTATAGASEPLVALGPPSMRHIIDAHGHNVLIAIFSSASFAILTYGGFVYLQSYLKKAGLSADGRMLAGLCARGLMILLAIPTGWLVDIKGVGFATFLGACLLAIGGLPLFAWLASSPTDLAVVVTVLGVCYAIIGAIGGSCYFYFMTELFPTPVRSVAVGISYNVGLSLFGGLSPVVAEASLAISPNGPGFLLSAGGCVSAVTVAVGICMQRRGLLRLAHVRPRPYFSSRDDLRLKLGESSGSSSSEGESDETDSSWEVVQ